MAPHTTTRPTRRRLPWQVLPMFLLLILANMPAASTARTIETVRSGSATAGTRYVTFSVARGLYAEAINCAVAPGAVDTFRVANYAARLGIPVSSNLIPARVDASRTAPNGHLCLHSTHLYMNLGEAHALRDRYGSQMLTSGKQYRVMVDLTRAEQIDEACGALTWMTNRGFTNARGMFAAAYPGGREPLTDDIVTEVVRGTCGYVWARNYGAYTARYHPVRADGTRIRTNVRGNLHPVGYYRVVSVNGYSCPPTALCNSDGGSVYMQPAGILRDLRDAPPDSHMVIQGYRFVSGDYPRRWHCTGPSSEHWTRAIETYCWEDFRWIMDNLPADYVATDPLTVARAWGLAN